MIYFVGQRGVIEDLNYATIEDVVSYCRTKNKLGVDTETEGFFDFENKIVMLQIGDEHKQFVIDVRYVDISPLKEIFINSNIQKLFWNAKFDYKFLKFHGIEVINIYDNMLCEIVITNGLNAVYSLDYACQKYLNKSLNKEVRNQFVNLKGNPFTHSQINYGAEDIENLIKIQELQQIEVAKYDLSLTVYLENKFVKVLSEIEYNGFYLDSRKWEELNYLNEDKLIDTKKVLDNYILDNNHSKFIDSQLDLFSSDLKCAVNWDSPKQVIEYLKFLGIDTQTPDKKTGKLKDTCEEKHLSKYKNKFEFIPLYLEYKKVAKSVSTYGLEFLKHINKKTGRIHSNYWQILTTGRISSNDPNLQNIPSDVNYRRCFEGQGDNILVVADYSQQEPRVLADVCQDENLVNLFLEGDGDTHTLVAEKMFSVIEGKPIKITKKDPRRQIGKVLNLKLNYGGSAYTVKDDLGVSEEEAQKFIDALEQAFPTKQKYFEKIIKETFDNGYILVDKVTKRKVFIPDFERFIQMQLDAKNNSIVKDKQFWSEYYRFKGTYERASKNYPIQGLSGSMTKVAGIYLYDKLKELNLLGSTRIVNLVHDEIVVETTEQNADIISKIVSDSMEKAGKVFCKTVPMTADAVVSKFWTH